jgi:hypothetical protein
MLSRLKKSKSMKFKNVLKLFFCDFGDFLAVTYYFVSLSLSLRLTLKVSLYYFLSAYACQHWITVHFDGICSCVWVLFLAGYLIWTSTHSIAIFTAWSRSR